MQFSSAQLEPLRTRPVIQKVQLVAEDTQVSQGESHKVHRFVGVVISFHLPAGQTAKQVLLNKKVVVGHVMHWLERAPVQVSHFEWQAVHCPPKSKNFVGQESKQVFWWKTLPTGQVMHAFWAVEVHVWQVA